MDIYLFRVQLSAIFLIKIGTVAFINILGRYVPFLFAVLSQWPAKIPVRYQYKIIFVSHCFGDHWIGILSSVDTSTRGSRAIAESHWYRSSQIAAAPPTPGLAGCCHSCPLAIALSYAARTSGWASWFTKSIQYPWAIADSQRPRIPAGWAGCLLRSPLLDT
jgi:hypothetical protein